MPCFNPLGFFNQPFGALGRSIELTKRQFLPAVGLVIVLWLIESLVIGNAQIIPVGLAQAVLAAALYACTMAFYACASTAFYFSGRCHTENFDLRLMIERAARDDVPADEDAPPQFAREAAPQDDDKDDDVLTQPESA